MSLSTRRLGAIFHSSPNSIESKKDMPCESKKSMPDPNLSSKSTEVKVEVLQFPYFPRELRLKDLNAKGNLEEDKECQKLDEEVVQLQSDNIYFDDNCIYPYFRISGTKNHYTLYESSKWENSNNSDSNDSDSEDEFNNQLPHHLGKTSYLPVYICQHSKNKKFYALKIIADDGIFYLDHFVVLKKTIGLATFVINPTRENRAILLKLARGVNLKKFLDQRTLYDLPSYRRIEIILGMLLCLLESQSKNIIHRDIKLGNFTYDPVRKSVTLVDFDSALIGENIEDNECIGTPGFIAPEHKNPDKNFVCQASDVYSLGMAIADLLGLISEKTAKYPRESLVFNGHELNPNNAKFIEIFKDETLCKQVFQFIKQMTALKPEQRPSASQCLEFFGDIYIKLLQQKTFRIGLVNLAELVQPNPQQKDKRFKKNFTKIINSIKEKKFDDVWFIDVNGNFTDIQKEQVKRRLLRNRISMADKIFCAPGAKVADVVAKIPEIFKQKNDPRQYKLVTFTPPESQKALSRANKLFKYEALVQKIPLSQNSFSVLAKGK